jgi:glycopeptide antibiotics resistance protein
MFDFGLTVGACAYIVPCVQVTILKLNFAAKGFWKMKTNED